MATMIHHHPSKRPHEEDINLDQGLLHPGSIKKQKVISPRGADTTTTNVAVDVYPDVIDLPEDTQQRRKHSLDIISDENGYSSEDEADELLAEKEPGSSHQLHHCRQRRRLDEIQEEDLDQDEESLHRVLLPSDFFKKIPEVVLEKPRQGPIIEEVPYNPLALIPYSAPPLVFFPGLSSTGYGEGGDMLPSAQEEGEEGQEIRTEQGQMSQDAGGDGGGGGDVEAMEVLPMLTPPDAGYMLGPWTVNNNIPCGDDDDDAMEE